jgi:sugar fermentation stimulation protein A
MKLSGSYHLGRFIERPNRFLAKVLLEDLESSRSKSNSIVEAHVPDPGRLKELFLPDAQVVLRESDNPNRKTQYSLIGVRVRSQTKNIWVNVDSQISNKLFQNDFHKIPEFEAHKIIRPEITYRKSRIDFLMENPVGKRVLVEIKGVTLVEETLALFPDAPTVRGTKHIHELKKAIEEKYEAAVVFFIKRSDATAFQPNMTMDPSFSKALLSAMEAGVKVYPVRCHFDPIESMELSILDLVPFKAP